MRAAPLLVGAAFVVLALAGCPELCCDADADCADGASCFEGVCARRCTHESQCREGEVCLEVGVCVGPGRADSVCAFELDHSFPEPEPEPEPEPGPDPGDGDGDGDGDGPCDTAEEPNDAAAAASSLQSGSFFICEDMPDNDWFRVSTAPGDTIEADIVFTHDRGDLDLQLVGPGPAFAVLDSSQSVSDLESVRVDVTQAGDHFVRVYGFAGEGGPYDLDIRVTPSNLMCEPDIYEPNNFPGGAYAIAAGQEAIEATVCSGDPDFYEAFLTPGFWELYLYNDGDQSISWSGTHVASGFGGSGTLGPFESSYTPFDIMQPGDLALSITTGATPGTPMRYFVELWGGPPPDCFPDAFEPNDDGMFGLIPGSLEVPSFIEANICPESDIDGWIVDSPVPNIFIRFDPDDPGLPWFAGLIDASTGQPVADLFPGEELFFDIGDYEPETIILYVVLEPGVGGSGQGYQLLLDSAFDG